MCGLIRLLAFTRASLTRFMKHRLLETLPTFVLPGDKYAIVNVASQLSVSGENMRQCQPSK